MAQFRQSGFDRAFINGGGSSNDVSNLDHVAIGVKSLPTIKQPRHHHHRRSRVGGSRVSIATLVSFLCFVLGGSSLFFLFLSSKDPSDVDATNAQEDHSKGDFLANVTRFTTSEVQFGHGSVINGRDSRYWDGDDRRRDEHYNAVVHRSNTSSGDITWKGHYLGRRKRAMKVSNDKNKGTNHHGLYNEAGRNELKMYAEKYEASLRNVGQSEAVTEEGNHVSNDGNLKMKNEEHDIDDEYGGGIDSRDALVDDYDDKKHENEVDFDLPRSHSQDDGDNDVKVHAISDVLLGGSSQNSSSNSHSEDNTIGKETSANASDGQSMINSRKRSKKRNKRRKFSSSHCEMKLLNSTALPVEPLESNKFARFSLSYTEREMKPDGVDNWEPRFAGHQSLRDREESFLAQDQKMNCGFVNGPTGHSSTGFELAEDDVRYISKCHIAVISCIFGNSDRLRSPFTKLVSRLSRKNVCFVMFMDKQTLQALSVEGYIPDRMGFIGLWRVVVVKNLPYSDMRRVGKIPKLLSHRLFPSARYSIWLDSKLRLQRDPLLLLEYLLWRKGYEYAISNHYDRHCVWEEVERNKKLNKFNHTMIDQQFAFYQADGLKRFNASDPNKMLPSNVPEGSLIVRAHTPMSNLFSCLWFNEVDRFTPRDQLSFAYTYQKLQKKNSDKSFYVHMFKDCERRKITKLFHHRAVQKQIVSEDAVV